MKKRKVWLLTLSGISQNISAGWFGVVLISQDLFNMSDWPITLTKSLILGILYAYLAVTFRLQIT